MKLTWRMVLPDRNALCPHSNLPAAHVGNLEIRVGNTPLDVAHPPDSRNALCKWVGNAAGTNTPFTVTCDRAVHGQYVSIQRKIETSDYLVLCEVQVGEPPDECFVGCLGLDFCT